MKDYITISYLVTLLGIMIAVSKYTKGFKEEIMREVKDVKDNLRTEYQLQIKIITKELEFIKNRLDKIERKITNGSK